MISSIELIPTIFLQYQGNKSRVEKLIKKSLVMEEKRSRGSRVWSVLVELLLWAVMLLCLGLFGTMIGKMLKFVFSEEWGEH